MLCLSVSYTFSPKNGPQISLHPESSPVDWLVTEGALLVPHLLLAAPAEQVARDALRNPGIGGHFIEASGAPWFWNVAVFVIVVLNFNFFIFS